MKNWIKFTAASIAIAAIAILSVIAVGDKKTIKSQQERIEEQGKVIDSLLNRRTTFIDCHLVVTDKSKNIIYGRYNKGCISQPQERKYILEIDSTNIKIR